MAAHKALLDWLDKHMDSKTRAVLVRSLAFPPSQYPAAYPYIEPFTSENYGKWQREVFYFVPALKARHKNPTNPTVLSFPQACQHHYIKRDKSISIEKRFITILESTEEQLFRHLSQMISILKDYQIDWEQLFNDLLWWNKTNKESQNRWARIFYRLPKPTNKEQ